MAVKTEAIGRHYPATSYEVGLEKIREFSGVVGEDGAVHRDRGAAQDAGYRDVVAPPMFVVVYAAPALGPAILDPEVGIDLARMVHGGQEFVWSEPVYVGDVITTEAQVTEIYEKDGKGFYVFESVSSNQDGVEVARGTWTNIVRGV